MSQSTKITYKTGQSKPRPLLRTSLFRGSLLFRKKTHSLCCHTLAVSAMEMRSKGSSGKSRKRKKKLQKLQQESWDAGPRPSQLPLDIEQYYLDFVSSLFACLHPRSFKVNHQTDLLKGKPRKAFSAVYHSFLGLNLRHRNKNTQERGPSSAFEESDGSVSLELNCLKQRRLLKELDGTRSESAFEDLQNWCYFQRVANGSGRTQTYGWGTQVVKRRHSHNCN
jgi:hypothetical protein